MKQGCRIPGKIILVTLLFVLILFAWELPEEIPAVQADKKTQKDVLAAQVDFKDGEYEIDVKLEGGSGRAAVSSPAVLVVKDGCAFARVEWSSSSYDYMKIEDEIYYPVNTEGNSIFEIPVTVFDEAMAVSADTTAMSIPHEISYLLTFYLDSVEKKNSFFVFYAAAVILAVCLVLAGIWVYRGRKNG